MNCGEDGCLCCAEESPAVASEARDLEAAAARLEREARPRGREVSAESWERGLPFGGN